jgi:uncharacterized surface protein with fasciclin (FAS1) repeats
MKHFLFSLVLLIIAGFPAANAQENPCEVDGIVVEASNYEYAPSSLEIQAGQTVVWVNMGGFHDVNGVESSIETESWTNPETFSFGAINGSGVGTCIGFQTFTVEGTYDYDCSIGNHAEQGMVASVTVVAPPSNSVVDVIVNSEDHTLLEAAVGAAGLVEALSGEGPFTVFAPTDAAIVALTEALGITADELLALPNLGEILQYHVVGALANAADLSDGQMIATLEGSEVTVSLSMGNVMINNANVTAADIAADNGVVHVIDAVLLPPTNTVVDVIVNSEDHTLLEAAVGAAGLVEVLSGEGPFTVFAPTDAAIVALTEVLEITAEELLALPNLGDILQYHVVGALANAADLSDGQTITTLQGTDVTVTLTMESVMINDATVTAADIAADNGVVHVIDAVLLPAPPPPSNTVVDIIVNSEDHTVLELAVVAADLVDALSAEGPFTVFAPTDAAFTALLEALEITADELLAEPELADVLMYHVVAAQALSTDLEDGQEITTLSGDNVTIMVNDMGVFVNQAMVTAADILADNGVVHVIDAVLIPEEEELPETVVDIIVASEDHTLLEAAVVAAGLVEALSGEGPFTVFAPTDAAIVALTEALSITAEELLALPNLGEILQYHVVAADAFAEDLSDGQMLTTLLGEDVTVSIDGSTVKINDATVIVADLDAENGVVHVIDAVLLPPTSSVIETQETLTCVVYPNPLVGGVLTVRGNWSAGAEFVITDIQGRVLEQTIVQSSTFNWDASSLESGIYSVTVLEGTQRQTAQVVVR